MRIGILGHEFVNWCGGIDFLRTVVDSLLAARRTEEAQIYLLIPDRSPRSFWRAARRGAKQAILGWFGVEPPPSAPPPAAQSVPLSATVTEVFANYDCRLRLCHIEPGRKAVLRAARRAGIRVLLPSIYPLGPDFPRPWVGYAYDFQHKHLPRYFTAEERVSRDRHFLEMTAQARAIVVNSRAAATDIARYVPGATAQVFALPFAPAPSPDWEDDFPETVARYGATSPFFLISNQFWIHKDHATAFAAFRIVAARHSEVRLVCTGQTGDARDPEYFPRLLADLKTWKLEDRVRILGLIPKRDQIELMKNAAAVIQPTRFEGGPGGGSVYDAVSLGVPAIVSDIPVNREIDCGSVEFFPVGDAAALAAQMETRLAASAPRPEWSVLVADGQRRRAACGMVLWQSIEFTLEAGKRVDWR